MILSLLDLDIASPGVRQSFRNCQDLHRSIMKAFDTDRKEANVLYRVIRSGRSVQIYVQSIAEPNWDRIAVNGFHCVKTKDISQLLQSFHENMILHFSLLGCPSKKVDAGDGKNSKRVLLRSEEEQLDWLKRQGEKYGFTLLETHVTGKGEKVVGSKGCGEYYLVGIPFEGTLQIQNGGLFCEGFVNGIGPEKAYGFGMLMVSKG